MNIRYLEFQTAQLRFQQPLAALDAAGRAQVSQEARQQWLLEERILASDEAADCPVAAEALTDAVAAICARYDDKTAFREDLAANGLDEAALNIALARQLRVEAVLARVVAEMPLVTEQDAEIFYWQHHERFLVPEARHARHVLVTINEELPSNTRTAARAKVAALAAEIRQDTCRFAGVALQHSECPTALQGGELGWVPRGHLYPELEAALFGMAEGEVSDALESPIGFHVLMCESIRPERHTPFAEVVEALLARLQQRRQEAFQRAWIRKLGQH